MLHNKARVVGLDFIRATAIILVVVSHALRFSPFVGEGAAQAELTLGFYGVEIFFVLSGFLIGTILLRVEKNPGLTGNFWMRRWMRTLPAYYTVLLITPLLYIAFFGAANLEFKQVAPYFVFAQNLWKPHPEFFGVAWSLSVEEWFYLLFPVGLFLMWKSKLRPSVPAVAITLFAIAIISRTIMSCNADLNWDSGIRKIVLCRIDAIVPGVLMAWLAQRYPFTKSVAIKLFVSGIFLFAFSFFLFCFSGAIENRITFLSTHILLPVTSVAMAFLIPLASTWMGSSGGATRVIRFISLTSYSLYLVHSVVWEIYLNYWIEQRNEPSQWLVFTGYIFISFIAAVVLHYAIERPFMRLREKKFPEKSDV
jgi:peptidoglycan/LPS O-acetylase OafA/YrhL